MAIPPTEPISMLVGLTWLALQALGAVHHAFSEHLT